jgi:hypothetical protein
VYKQKKRVDYQIKQAIEELTCECPYCSEEYNYGETAKHQKRCEGLNYACPNSCCKDWENTSTKDDLRRHLQKECKFMSTVC